MIPRIMMTVSFSLSKLNFGGNCINIPISNGDPQFKGIRIKDDDVKIFTEITPQQYAPLDEIYKNRPTVVVKNWIFFVLKDGQFNIPQDSIYIGSDLTPSGLSLHIYAKEY